MPDTGQPTFDGYSDAGLDVALGLVNELAVGGRRGQDALEAISALLEFDPPTHTRLGRQHVEGFTALATTLHEILVAVTSGEVDVAAHRLNQLLEAHPANPHLARADDGTWQLHHHPATVELVPMYTAICAEMLARLVGTGLGGRLGLCADPSCGRAFFDHSKNSSRRFCSLTCQNRVKTAAFRARRRGAPAGP